MEEQPKRKQLRLSCYDYSSNGYYFVTICTKDRKKILSKIVGNAVPSVPPQIKPTKIGKIVLSAWGKLSEIDENIETDCFCLMPNHIHAIVVIKNQEKLTTERWGQRSLQSIIRGFKSVTTRQYNKLVSNSYNL